jgi:site-specific recombinase XerD
VKELLGHVNIATTAIYLHSRAEAKIAAVARLVSPENVIQFAEGGKA